MKTKTELAHEWAMKIIEGNMRAADASDLIERAWEYADAMQAEADKREKEEAAQKRKEIRDMLNAPNTFVEREGQHFDDVADVCKTYTSSEEWQPDWSQAPDSAMYWAMDGCGQCNWYEREPKVCGSQWDFGSVVEQADTGYDYQGDWRESLRERPL